MARLYPILLLALLILVLPVEAAGQYGQLGKLSELKIVVLPFSNYEKKLELNEDNIKNQIFEFLRSKLPRVSVKESAIEGLNVIINLGENRLESGGKAGYNGLIDVRIYRLAKIKNNGLNTNVIVWSKGGSLAGPTSGGEAFIKEVLAQLLAQFAADWNKDNPRPVNPRALNGDGK